MSRLSKNIASNVLGQGLSLILSFVAVRCVFRGLGGDALGLIYFSQSVSLVLPVAILALASYLYSTVANPSVAPAPAWIRENGFEWLWRLIREPRRFWRRSVLYGPQFALFATLELSGLMKLDS